MSDRVSPANGKRSAGWGTLQVCPACGRCLCFGCHPEGPCTEEPRTTVPAFNFNATPSTGASPSTS